MLNSTYLLEQRLGIDPLTQNIREQEKIRKGQEKTMRFEPHHKYADMFKGHECCIEHGGNYAVIDRTLAEGSSLFMSRNSRGLRTSRWCVYDLTERLFGEWRSFSSKKKALTYAHRLYGE